jgi:hypothetical protein
MREIVFIRLPTYWLRVINQNRQLLLDAAVFPDPNFTALTCPDALPPVNPLTAHVFITLSFCWLCASVLVWM